MHGIILPVFGLPVHTAIMIYIIIGLAIFAAIAGKRFTLVPGKMQSLLELVASGFLNMVDENMGHKGRKYFPFILTLAVFIFISNALGLVPGLLPPTANLNCTLGLALVVFFMTHIIGVKEHGLKYFKHFVGPVWWLAPLMIPIEIIGHLARPLSLSLRLFGNMMGHEQIVMVLLILMPIAYPLLAVSTALGILVIFIQAFIFALLSMLYLGGALEEAH
ncbi:MAG: ATP synthase F0 subunit A [Deltaproteobacteria bacterium GWC2_56_8]|nr:MAG: ATP synthase F0 subunit A [Deltaproteobacteria bacterium GWB2_55_19]OGP37953.1 MAG: ATP synthase F0 subunit A [Deltaproteobacteria bacterium GWC2_56_8]HAO93075.1 ATP synthase F0 subunit A [Deltaproteobacteria bacterium]